VGLTGLAVNTAVLAFLVQLGGLGYLLAAILATQASTSWNFALTERWVFRHRERRRAARTRLLAYFGINNVAMALRAPVLVLLTGAGLHYLVANVVSLLAFTLVRFAVADAWIWSGGPRRKTTGTVLYDIHG